MDRQRWEQIKDLFERALELAPEARASFLAQACGDNLAVRSEVEALLDHDRRAGSFMEEGAAADMGIRAIGSAAHLTLSPGEILSERFQIAQFLGRGGMGEVYEAKDLELGERIALKTIRPEIAFEQRGLARFKHEIQLARRVTHPNVCRMFDLGRCQVGPTATVVTFLTMELIKGETLAAKLRNQGRMTTTDALPLIQQMADALAAAHDVGVVHRDFKPGNVMLAAAKSDAKGKRAVVTDFGLARAVAASIDQSDVESTASSLTHGHHLGTPAYMAPEQLEGYEATPATDVYALGLVMYEILAGRKPFLENGPLAGAFLRLKESPPSPRVYVPDLDQHWENTILRCLETDPGARFQSAKEVAAGFAGHSTARSYTLTPRAADVRSSVPKPANLQATAAPAARVQNIRKIGPLAAAIVLVGLMAGEFYWRTHRSPKLTAKDTIVLADFLNTTGDPVFDDTLKQGVAVALRQSPFLSVLSDSQVTSTLELMERPPGAAVTGEVAREVCQRTGSRAYIAGSVAALGSQYVLGLKAVGCADGETLAEEQATAPGKETVLNALGHEAAKLRGELGESLASVHKFDTPLEQATTSSLEALKALSEASRVQAKQGPGPALPFAQRAVALDPDFAVAYSALASLHNSLGQRARADKYISKAFALRERTSERENLEIAINYYYLVTGDLEKAEHACQELIAEYPKDRFGYESLAHVRGIQGDWAAYAELERDVIRLSPSYVSGYINLGWALMGLGRLNEGRSAFEEASFRKLGVDHLGFYNLAFLAEDNRRMSREAAWFQDKPDLLHFILSSEGDTEAYAGHLAKARELTRRAAAAALQANNSEAAATAHLLAALREAAFGNNAESRREANVGLRLAPDNRDIEVQAALADAWNGAERAARKLESDLKKRFPLDTLVNEYWLPTVEARAELAKNHAEDAVDRLQGLGPPLEFGNVIQIATGECPYPVYTRGEAYLAAGQGSAAAGEFQKILDHPGIVLNCATGALAHLGLARAYALEAGIGALPRFTPLRVALKSDQPKAQQGASAADGLAKARAAYQNFFALWKNADPDIPILKQAKAEYAGLP
jgi:serine/threonine protein kinase/Flp pilus assembly protein TadD